MTTSNKDIERIRKAKEGLIKEFGHADWFRGAGIAPAESGWVLRLNVDPDTELGEQHLPVQYQGFDVEVVYIGTYKLR